MVRSNRGVLARNPLTAAERAAKYSPSEQELPARTARPKDERERLSDLRSYNFGAAIAALQTMDSPRATQVRCAFERSVEVAPGADR